MLKIKNESVSNTDEVKRLTRKLAQSQAENKKVVTNYETAIHKLHEFQANLLKEREKKFIEKQKIESDLDLMREDFAEKIKKIETLEIYLNEYKQSFQISQSIYKEIKDENEKLKFENEKFKSQKKNRSESSFITQVRNQRLEATLQQKSEFESKINEIEKAIKILEQENSSLKVNFKTKVNQNECLSNNNSKLTENNRALNERIAVLEQDLNNPSALNEIKSLKANLSEKDLEIEKLNQTIKSIEDNHKKVIDDFQIRISLLEAELNKLKTDLTARNQIKLLKLDQLKDTFEKEKEKFITSLKDKDVLIGILKCENEIKINSLEQTNKTMLNDIKMNHEKELAVTEHNFKSLLESKKSLELDLDKAEKSLKLKDESLQCNLSRISELDSGILVLKSSVSELGLELKNLNDEKQLIAENNSKLKEHHESQISLFQTREIDFKSLIKNLASKNSLLNESNVLFENFLKQKDIDLDEAEMKLKLNDEIIGTHMIKINELESAKAAYENEIEILKSSLSNLKLEFHQLKEKIEEENKSLSSALKDKDVLIGILKNKHEIKLNLIVEKNAKYINEIKANYEKELNFLKNKEKNSNNLIIELETKYNNSYKSVTSLEFDLDQVKKNLILKDDAIDFLLNKINQLESSKVANENEINLLKSCVSRLECRIISEASKSSYENSYEFRSNNRYKRKRTGDVTFK